MSRKKGYKHSEETKEKMRLAGLNGITLTCKFCGKEFYVNLYRKDKAKYCSYKCHFKGRNIKGENHPNWKGGNKLNGDKNRLLIWKPEHLFSNGHGYVFRYRLVAEKCLGRYLTKDEVIHHINGNSLDDRPENLYLFATIGKHTGYHFLKTKPILKSNIQ